MLRGCHGGDDDGLVFDSSELSDRLVSEDEEYRKGVQLEGSVDGQELFEIVA